MFMIVLSIFLFYGIYKENIAFLVPWVVGCMTFMALEAMAMVYSNILRDHVNKYFLRRNLVPGNTATITLKHKIDSTYYVTKGSMPISAIATRHPGSAARKPSTALVTTCSRPCESNLLLGGAEIDTDASLHSL
ncbi:unnamed protein product [Chilo suppressalis]|uniref:Uncharacterized protein n=1 Tax=Chilo suppressalis TaxID=168631 RepID=A0ABN8ASL4_CHISP|nr:unnamed protein product [Chilo suppressalis]